MEIKIILCHGLEKKYKNYNKEQGILLDLERPVSIKYIIKKNFSKDIQETAGIILANKKIVDINYQIKDGDVIEIFPLIGGG